MLLFLLAASTGAASALAGNAPLGVRVVQQSGTCSGVVKDASGETIIGASVVVKGTTNGTITGLDGDFSLSNVKKGDAFYAIGEYFDAAGEYKKAYARTPVKDKAKRGERAWKMAECYRRINFTAKALGA